MGSLFSILWLLFGIGALVCHIIILVAAFKDAIWKGLVGLLCGFYLLYYAFVEFDHEKKTQIIAGWLIFGILATICRYASYI